ncbi:phage tail tape measure protein (plasmid) [Bacillus velezensis]|uniref:phage tail tape measure protein n=1 Tax=Bacillus velezensis TaxID=492670 RepID=UPI00202566A6|nr:phage tail tape measure protein [Bacillus velezensis]URJ76434.1 phage tail tape measure protein [Bacillus velezensis]URJ80390.1 phage tail tape measure protein [Bacillus velezensis]
MSNRIGIEVQVEFPTVGELKSQLAEKWKRVGSKFDGKINIDINENSIKSAKAKIKRSLGNEVFDVKLNLDIKKALSGLEKIHKKINEVDAVLKKERKLNVSFKVSDMDKSLKEILKSSEKTNKSISDQSKVLKGNNKELDKSISNYEKIQQISRQLKDGSYATTIKSTGKSVNGDDITKTERPDGRVDYSETDNRKQALKEIESLLKRIQKIELDQIGASKEQRQLLEKEKRVQSQQLQILRDQYYQKYKLFSFGAESTKELLRIHEMNKALKNQAILAQKVKEEQNEIASAISKVAQLESKKQSLARQIASASQSEVTALREQYEHHNRIQREMMQEYNLQEKMTAAQKEELENIRRIGFLETQRARAKKEQREQEQQLAQEERERQQREKQAYDDIMSDLKKIHRLKQEIEGISLKGNQSNGDRDRLATLQEELKIAKESYAESRRHYSQEGLLTDELKAQVRAQRDINQAELERIRRLASVQNSQTEVNDKLNEYRTLTQRIAQLQRDLIYSGMREKNIIENQLRALEQKRTAIKEGLRSQNQLTDSIQNEVRAIERAQAEQRKLNSLRREAREKDQAFNDTGGLVDPYSFYANVEQGAQAILEPVARLDDAMVGVKKVASATEAQFGEFESSAYDTATALGVTADQYVLAVEKWVTAGKTFKESQEMANISVVGSFVGNINVDDMVKYMSVPLNAFEKEGLKAQDVINSMNETANNHAIEMDDLGKAYVRSAGTVKETGASFADLTGFITAAQEATRKGGERIGTGIKTIGMNMTNINAQMTKGEKRKFDFFSDIGVKFRDDQGQMLTMTKILENLVGVWDNLSQEDKGTAKFYLAGKEHAETLQGVIDQWKRVKEVASDVDNQMGLGDKGSAYIEFAKQSDSVKFKLAELKNAWDKLMATIGGGSGGIADVLSILSNGLEKVTELAGNEKLMNALKYVFAGMAIHAGANLYKRFFDTVVTGFGRISSKAKEAKALMKDMFRSREMSAVTSTGVTGGIVGRTSVQPQTTNSSGAAGSHVILGANGRPISNNNDDGNRSRQLNDQETRANRVTGKLKTAGKLLASFAGFLPIIGDALLVMDLMGVPVFEKMGDALGGLVQDSKALGEQLEKNAKKLTATNSILNGDATKRDEKLGGMSSSFNKKVKDKGYLDSNEFTSFQKEFNDMTNDLGVDIKITMNDTDDIKAKIQELKDKLLDLKQADLETLGKDGFAKDTSAIDEAREKIAEEQALLKEYEEKAKDVKAIVDELETKQKKQNGFLDPNDLQMLSNARGQLSDFNNDITTSKGIIQDQKDAIGQATSNIEGYTNKLVDFVSRGGSLKGMNHEAIKQALGVMITDYNKLQDSMRKLNKTSNELSSSNKIQKNTWKSLQQEYPALRQFNVDEVNGKSKVRKEVKRVIDSEKEKQKKTSEATRKAIEGASSEVGAKIKVEKKTGHVTEANKKLADKIKDVRKEANEPIKDKKITWSIRLKKVASKLWNFITGKGESTSTVTVPVDAKEKGKSVSSIEGQADVSSSISSIGASIIKSPVSVSSFDTSTNNVTNDEYKSYDRNDSYDKNAKVNSDVWRYWNRESYSIDANDNAVKALTYSINKANDNQDKLIKLYGQQQSLLKKQINNYKGLYSDKDKEMNSTLKSLKKYGFKVNTSTNKVTNLSHAKSLKGKKATEAETLLNTWKSLYSEMSGIKDTMSNINSQVDDLNEKIKQAKISKELKKFESQLKRIDALMKSVDNSESISSLRLELVGEGDKEQKIVETENAMNATKSNMSKLINEFNKLSKASISYKENGEDLKTTLDKLGSEILSQADAIIKYKQSLNDLKIGRITEDLNDFNNAIDSNTSKISNNINNLKEGLVSGTKLSDLESSRASGLDLYRDNKYETIAQERINLEKEVQQALDAFAKKNVDRVKKVSQSTLDINAKMYNNLLKMQKEFTSGKKVSSSKIKDQFDDLYDIGKVDPNYSFVTSLDDSFDNLKNKQDKLTSKYESDLKKALTQKDKDSLTNKYIVDNMKLQEDYFKSSIDNSKKAITSLKKMLSDSSLTDDQEQKIKDQIANYEKDITEAQNNIKDSIKSRFEFEFSLLDKAISEYDKYSNQLDYAMDILDAIGGDRYDTKDVLYNGMADVEEARNKKLKEQLSTLKKQMSLYEQGSYEWNLLNDEVDKYNKSLQESNKHLLEINKEILTNAFADTSSQIEKTMFGGKTLEQYKNYQELWMEGLEREIALENVYKRMADLGTTAYNQKMSLLEKQEKLSKFEMDYLNAQLDVLELQQKLSNLNKEKTVQTLKQNEDGTWDWKYEADADQISEVQDELAEKQLALQQLEQKAREDYLSKLQDILTGAENGNYNNIDEFKDAINDLGDAFSSILGDFPQIQENYLKDIVDSYSKYITDNSKVLKDVGLDGKITSPVYEGFSKEVVKAFENIGDSMAKVFADTLIKNIPSLADNNLLKANETGKSININLEKIEFPNITSPDGIKEAILSLPQVALQESKKK